MTQERVDKLNALGFNWGNEQIPWGTRYAQLKKYSNEHGDSNVPQKFSGIPGLGKWVNNQRTYYKYFQEGRKDCMGMTPERIRRLESIGFRWTVA